MSLPPNNQTPPRGDDGFERHYQAGSQEVPGGAADAAVLALARAAAAESRLRASVKVGGGDPGARGWLRRWQAPLALAACLVLAVGVVTRMQTQLPDATEVANSVPNQVSGQPASPAPQPVAEPAPVAAAASSSPRPESTRVQPALTPSAEKASDSRRASAPAAEMMSAPDTPSVAAPNSAAPAAIPVPLPGAPAMARDAAAGGEPRAMSRMAAQKSDSVDAGVTEAQESTLTPQAWLARIVGLRSNGRLDEADASLKRFRERHPAVQVPAAASGQPE